MNSQSENLIKGVCIFGLIIALLFLGILVFLSLYGNIPLFAPFLRGASFSAALADYDAKAPDLTAGKRNALLDALEKKAADTDNHLSVLKRRRALAAADAGSASAYAAAAARIRKQYPFSAQTAALAAESLVLNSGRLADREKQAVLEMSSLMTEGALSGLALSFAVYSGAMGDPSAVRELPGDLFPLLCSWAEGAEREKYLVNAAIAVLFEQGASKAAGAVNALFEQEPLLAETWLFGADFFYDHGNFVRSAELFSHFNDDENLARQADALWLAGFSDSAGALWQAAGTNASGDTRARSLYNTASVSSSPAEEETWLARLFADNPSFEPGRVFGTIRYSRLAPADRAVAIMESADRSEPLFDLELLRRRAETWSIDKTVAETWVLVNNHPGDPRLMEWAGWYFDFQRRYEEASLLIANAERSGMKAPWIEFHKAVTLIRENNFSGSEKLFREAGGIWQASANLGLLLDLRRNPRESLELYEIAAGLQANKVNRLRSVENTNAQIPSELKDAARVQLRIVRCLRALDRQSESRRALDYVLDLDPDNLEAALEKRRLDNRAL